jgi:cephalosporin-C deacetylase-like acetyl esterase
MRKHQIENAAYEVATQVRAVEDSIDAAFAEVAELQARMMRINLVASTGYGTIHPALQKVAAAVAALVDTRGAIVDCHAALAEAKGKVPGLRTVAIGDEECPPASAQATLRVVA